VIAAGAPEEIVAESASYTGRFLAELLPADGKGSGSPAKKRPRPRASRAKVAA
jgi:hypothetical protein